MRSKVALPALVLLLSGCALIKQGTSQFVQIDTKPTGAEFAVDGATYKTPFAGELPKQEHVLTFKAKGFKDTTYVLKTRTSSYFYWSLLMGVIAGSIDWISGAWQEFDLDNEEGKLKPIDLEPSEDNPEQYVLFSSSPAYAFIKIDGVQQQQKTGPKGKSAARILVKWGDKEGPLKKVKLILDDHEEVEAQLRRGQREFHIELIPVPRRHNVVFESNPSGAEVFVNGVRLTVNTTPVTVEQVWKHGDTVPRKVEFRKQGYKPDGSQEIKNGHMAANGDVLKVTGNLELTVKQVPLKIDCWPAGSTIEVDEKPAAESPATLLLAWSVEKKSYKIRFTRPGYAPEEVVIDEAQNETPVTRRLKPSLPRYP